MPFTYVIEHMEEDENAEKTLPEWVELEYLHMRTLAGPNAQIHFTHLSASSSKALSSVFSSNKNNNDSETVASLANATAHQIGVLELLKAENVPLAMVCLLDLKAEKELSPQDGEGSFDYFLFGGILGTTFLSSHPSLSFARESTSVMCPGYVAAVHSDSWKIGDDPPRDRTAELRKLGFPTRHLGNVQMTTDTALGVTKKVVQDGLKLDEIPYVDFPTITFNANESVEMPFRYIAVNGEPLLPPGMRELLHKDLDKGFDIEF